MCPLRFILVFFSAVLAGYFAWRQVRSSAEVSSTLASDESTGEKMPLKDKEDSKLIRAIQNGLWVFVDMASGRYLWRNLREIKKN